MRNVFLFKRPLTAVCRPRSCSCLVALVTALLTTGCASSPPEPTLTATSAATPITATALPTSAGAPPEVAYPAPGEPTADASGYPAPTPDATSAIPTPAPTAAPTAEAGGAGYALRFFGTGQGDVDRVKVALNGPANIGRTDFTLEFWLKANPGENASTTANCAAPDGWITGNIVVDRDVWGGGDYGDFGLSLANGRVVFGVAKGESGATVCGQRDVTDGDWHHIAVTREAASGRIRLFVDGRLDGEALGPAGDVSYRLGRATSYANDPFLVLGAEKHDYDPATYPSFRGWLDEVRLSTIIRYSTDFERPRTPFQPDAETAAIWRFDEGAGELAADSAPGGASLGQLKVGGPNNGPQWVPSDAPLIVPP